MIKFFKGIKRVYIGGKNVILNNISDEAKTRLNICMSCDRKVRLTKNEYICGECGCMLKAKCASPDEKCYLNKW